MGERIINRRAFKIFLEIRGGGKKEKPTLGEKQGRRTDSVPPRPAKREKRSG